MSCYILVVDEVWVDRRFSDVGVVSVGVGGVFALCISILRLSLGGDVFLVVGVSVVKPEGGGCNMAHSRSLFFSGKYLTLRSKERYVGIKGGVQWGTLH